MVDALTVHVNRALLVYVNHSKSTYIISMFCLYPGCTYNSMDVLTTQWLSIYTESYF